MAHRREAYARAYAACARKGLAVTKLAFGRKRCPAGTAIPAEHRWMVFPLAEKTLTGPVSALRTFGSLSDVEGWLAAGGTLPGATPPGVMPPPMAAPIDLPLEPERAPAPVPAPTPATLPAVPKGPRQASLDDALDVILRERTGAVDEAQVRRIVAEAIATLDRPAPVVVKVSAPGKPDLDIDATGEHAIFPELVRQLALGHNVLVCGPTGSGKTTVYERAAKAVGRRLFLVPPVMDAIDVFGYRDAHGTYRDTPVYRALTCKEPALIVLDEIDRSDPQALTSANTVLGGNGVAAFPHEQVEIPPDLMIGATANTWGTGADATYVGANKLDGATLARFPVRLWADYDLALETRLGLAVGGTEQSVKRCQAVRAKLAGSGIHVAWTPRDTMAHCRMIAAGMGIDEAFNVSVLATLRPEQRAKVQA